MDLVQRVEQEEEQSTASSDRTVLFARLVDLELRGVRLINLVVDLLGNALRLLEALDQHHVLGYVTLRVGELREEAVLNLLEFDGELIVLDDDVRLGSLQVRPLLVHDEREQLVLQAIFSDREVDHCRLRLHLRRVVRIAQLRVKVQLEVRVVLHLGIPNLHKERAALLEGRPRHNRHHHGIDRLDHVLDEHRRALCEAALHNLHRLRTAHAHNL